MTATAITDRPTLEEAYENACESGDLGVSADRRGDADILIASAWSDSRLGASLARAHTKATANDLVNIAEQLERRGIKRGITIRQAAQVLAWWLDQTCKACDGHGRTRVPGAPVLSHHACQACGGIGKKQIPHGQDGRWMANLLDAAVQSWRQSLKGRFKHQATTP